MTNNSAEVYEIKINNVYNDVMTVLNDFNSETGKEYLRALNEYFRFFNNGKELHELTKEEVEFISDDTNKEKITLKHATKYRNYLKRKHPEGFSTVNKKMAGIKSVYKKLQGYGYNVDHIAFALRPLKVHHNSYGVLKIDQVIVMAELAQEEKFHGAEKEAFILLAAVTSIRAEALVSAELSNIKYNKKNDLYVIKVIDKGDEYVTAPFDKTLYEKIIKLTRENDDRVFPNLTVDSINDCVKRLASKMGIPADERITTHSLRKTAPVYELEDSGSLERAQKQTRHKSVQVLADHYTDKTKDFGMLAGIRMFQEVDESVFENVSKEEILEMLKLVNLAAYNQLALKLKNDIVMNEI